MLQFCHPTLSSPRTLRKVSLSLQKMWMKWMQVSCNLQQTPLDRHFSASSSVHRPACVEHMFTHVITFLAARTCRLADARATRRQNEGFNHRLRPNCRRRITSWCCAQLLSKAGCYQKQRTQPSSQQGITPIGAPQLTRLHGGAGVGQRVGTMRLHRGCRAWVLLLLLLLGLGCIAGAWQKHVGCVLAAGLQHTAVYAQAAAHAMWLSPNANTCETCRCW